MTANMAAATNDESPDWATKIPAAMAAALTLASPVLAFLASAGGGFERMLRNDREWTFVASTLVAVGFLLVLFGFFVLTGTSTKKNAYAARLFVIASLVILAGMGGMLWTAGRSASLREEPSIAASVALEPVLHLDATIRTSGLQADERVNVEVAGFRPDGSRENIYISVTGPDRSGSIELPISLPISSGYYAHLQISVWSVGTAEPDCNEAERGARAGAACARILMVRPTPS